jgi:hypothetical protein
MKVSLLIIFTSLFFLGSLMAQAPAIEWSHCYGGSDYERGEHIQQTLDGGYILSCMTGSNNGDVSGNHGGSDLWILKLDALGYTQWSNCYGGSNDEDWSTVLSLPDSGYIIGSITHSNNGNISGNHGNGDAWILRIDKNGNTVWQKCFGGSLGESQAKIISTLDGNFLIFFSSISTDGDLTGLTLHGVGDLIAMKIDTSGNIIWKKCYGGSNDDWAIDVTSTFDSCYIILSTTFSTDGDMIGTPSGGANAWVAKIDGAGNLIWTLPLAGGGLEFASSVVQMRDSTLRIGATTNANGNLVSGNHGDGDYWIIKVSADGVFLWQKCLGGTLDDVLSALCKTADEGIASIGSTISEDGDVTGLHSQSVDYWVVKADSAGNILWQNCLGGTGNELGYNICESADGGIMVTGDEVSDDGDVNCSFNSNSDVWVAKIYSTSVEVQDNPNTIGIVDKWSFGDGYLNISFMASKTYNSQIILFDLLGRYVAFEDIKIDKGRNEIQLPCSNLANGLFFLSFYSQLGKVSKKILLTKE